MARQNPSYMRPSFGPRTMGPQPAMVRTLLRRLWESWDDEADFILSKTFVRLKNVEGQKRDLWVVVIPEEYHDQGADVFLSRDEEDPEDEGHFMIRLRSPEKKLDSWEDFYNRHVYSLGHELTHALDAGEPQGDRYRDEEGNVILTKYWKDPQEQHALRQEMFNWLTEAGNPRTFRDFLRRHNHAPEAVLRVLRTDERFEKHEQHIPREFVVKLVHMVLTMFPPEETQIKGYRPALPNPKKKSINTQLRHIIRTAKSYESGRRSIDRLVRQHGKAATKRAVDAWIRWYMRERHNYTVPKSDFEFLINAAGHLHR